MALATSAYPAGSRLQPTLAVHQDADHRVQYTTLVPASWRQAWGDARLQGARVDIRPLRDIKDVVAEAVRPATAGLQDAATGKRPQPAQHTEQAGLACRQVCNKTWLMQSDMQNSSCMVVSWRPAIAVGQEPMIRLVDRWRASPRPAA